MSETTLDTLPCGIVLGAVCLGLLAVFLPEPAAARQTTAISGPEENRGGTVVESIREVRFYDANGDSHVFEVEELPSWAGDERAGALQVSPVASATYATDTDYLLIHPRTGRVDFGGSGPLDLQGSHLLQLGGLEFKDRNDDGLNFRLHELGPEAKGFGGMFRFQAERQTGREVTLLLINPDQKWVGFPEDVGIRGKLGVAGVPITLGEPLHVNNQPVRGLPEEPCETCAVRADHFDADGNGRVDVAETVEDLRGAAGCEAGQWCTTTKDFEVPAGETVRVDFDRTFSRGLPQLVETPTFQPDGSSDRVPAITIQSVLHADDGGVTGVVLRNGDADAAHTGSVAIQGIVR